MTRPGQAGDLLLQALLGSDVDAIVTIGTDATLGVLNAGARRLLGADDPAGLAGRPWLELWSAASRPAAEAALAVARAGGTARFQGIVASGEPAGSWDAVLRPL